MTEKTGVTPHDVHAFPVAGQREKSTPVSSPTESEAADHLVFADAALALAGHRVSDPELRAILERAALHAISSEDAIAAIRRHVQG
ncbi:antitoxin VbhA family protein [Mycetocola saprophilus]|uniref:antitoxin VbhA family protein n=1 Tax=Mycetocola saprophilus TaxID=76636 RepID=UPI0009DF0BA1|nr:antitoxin VbhA family protein [Mycetocola saprophilus]